MKNIDKNNNARSYLKKILESQEFSRAQKYQRLLQYLVDASLEGEIPKEVTIAHEVFFEDNAYDTGSTTKVRVYIHNLRKKLDSYYTSEGKNNLFSSIDFLPPIWSP